MSTTSIGQLLFTKYAPFMAAVLILWDHCTTFDEEVAVMWGSLKGQILTKVMNTGYIMMRAYRLWDRRNAIHKTLTVVFVACIIGATIFSVRTVLIVLRSQVQLPLDIEVCAIGLNVPKTIAYTMGLMACLFFNLFVIFITLYNALEIPRRSEYEIFDSLWHDGGRLYLIASLLWMLLLIGSVTIQMPSFFPILMLVWSLKSNIASRMHLRIESLRLSFTTHIGQD
ncbi:uncharacterized protein EV420DRAFT_1649040 [Desarmillaria tabescens]|uniref:DUF6533 domain-containing protein n=1 Tax=Armillaria tabescens TaxID=1929756 RepID=A0AA39JJI6_ARMTA|nr:uncharacterized protein EV420DRAFT_1649040 [Desarmillaria tabescens]KAK0443932.1 hypothetical protein EV420DRAFT_1649040 [Desarmillaria tabescens]